ncbi:MAG: LytTR family DNA-binding domain-containing protein [Prolixibacteraceae bacterium]|nr:LytTR family DNA-binding domain-containing protein [Prolixibacteraceae bacterium]
MHKQKLSAIIIDDELPAIEQLKALLEETGRIEITGSLTSPEKALCQIVNKKPDILFIDIQMPVLSGIDLLKALSGFEKIPYVVVVTAYEDYMLEAFRNSAFDFLLKPVGRDEIDSCIDRVEKGLNNNPGQNFGQLFNKLNNRLTVTGSFTTHYIDLENILYLQADGRYSKIHLTSGKTISSCRNLGNLFEEIKINQFIRISRSCVINSDYLTRQNHNNRTLLLEANGTSREVAYSKRFLKLGVNK